MNCICRKGAWNPACPKHPPKPVKLNIRTRWDDPEVDVFVDLRETLEKMYEIQRRG